MGKTFDLDPVMLDADMTIDSLLQFYMGKNTPDRQKFIIENLKVELRYYRRRGMIEENDDLIQ